MTSGPSRRFNGGPLVFSQGRNDSTSYLLQPEMSPSPRYNGQIPLSPAYSYAGDISPGSSQFPMSSWSGSQSFNSTLGLHVCPSNRLPLAHGQKNKTMYNNRCYGVGDLEGVRIEGMNQGNNKMYDYADMHQYEELPGGRKSMHKFPMDNGGDSRSEYQSSGGATDVVSETDDTAVIVNQNEKRKRVNPLYDHMAQSVPSIYNKVKNEGEKKLRGQVTCLKWTMFILIFLCCASIAISTYAVISNRNIAEPNPEIKPTVAQLVANYSHLERLYESLQGILYSNTSSGNSSMDTLSVLVSKVISIEEKTKQELDDIRKHLNNATDGVDVNAEYISFLQTNLTAQLMRMNSSIEERLNTISKMPGPQGPSGVGNLSMCYYENKTNNSPASTTYPSFSPWGPSIDQLEAKVAMFAACSTEGGEYTTLLTNVLDSNKVQYHCRCTGKVETPENRRYCYLHLWLCPRYS